jgi:ATP-dependent helicase HrpB
VSLPVEAVLDDLKAVLRSNPNAVLVAPPGAGKTTMVASALLGEPWCDGQILLLSPRRLAARAAAERIAELVGEPVGQSIGYATRMDSRQSDATRILVLTEGIFRTQIQDDPELAGVSAVLFDEVHERSLDGDFGLALVLDAQGGLRPDLRLVAMSATLDGSRFSSLMDAPVIESEGRSWPLSLKHIGRKAEARVEDEMAAAIRIALREEDGDILAFLPGVAEIERTAEQLVGIGAELHRLHGSLDLAEQRAAIRTGHGRKVILATSIAETSLTIDGVRVVVDSGLARRARYDRAAGSTRLVTERASQAAVTQRAGRAARQRSGIAYRLWEEAATAGLPPYDPPEILEADLSSLLLDCALWGVSDPTGLRWLDPPPKAALDEARARLTSLKALDANGRLTDHGRAIARLPLPPRLAHMLVRAGELGFPSLAAEVAVLLSERGLGGNDVDIGQRLSRWRGERGQRAEAARGLVKRWVKSLPLAFMGKGLGEGESVSVLPLSQPFSLMGRGLSVAIALAYPDRIAKRRDASGEYWLSMGGRGFRLDPAHPLAKEEWLAVADIQGAASAARILSAAPIDFADIEALYGEHIKSGTQVRFDTETRGVRTESGRRFGAIMLSKGQDAQADPAAVIDALVQGVRDHGLSMLTWADTTTHLRSRAAFAGLDILSDSALLESIHEWLPPLLTGKRRLSEVDMGALQQSMLDRLGWDGQQHLNRIAPSYLVVPAGQSHYIDYDAPGGPTVTLRVQGLFGLTQHPVIGSARTPLILSLTSPAGRPIQTTRDLPGFWKGSWADVAKEMRGRYPKHNWPDDPVSAVASLKTKKKQGI